MTDKNNGLQVAFLSYVCEHKTPLTVFLVNGVKLQGNITRFDNFCLLLTRDGHSQLIFKSAISTIQPSGPIDLSGDAKPTDVAAEPAAEPAPAKPFKVTLPPRSRR